MRIFARVAVKIMRWINYISVCTEKNNIINSLR